MNIFDKIFRKNKQEEVAYAYDGKDKLSIVKTGANKELRFNNIVYSKLSEDSVYTGSYWDYFTPLPALYEEPKILMIGLGGGTIAIQFLKLFPNKNLHIDAIEISEKMIKLAKDFGLRENKKVDVINADGLEYVKKRKNVYDIIILDAYTADRIPAPFIQDEFINDCAAALTNDGILAINYALGFTAIVYLEPYLSRLRKLFKVYKITPPMSGNMIIICSKSLDKESIKNKLLSKVKNTGDNSHVINEYASLN